jgi:hypothetical protein
MALREQSRAQGAGRDAVEQQRLFAAQLLDIGCGGKAVVGAMGDRRIVVARLSRAAVSLHIDAPGVVAARGKEIHGRGIGAPRYLQIEGRLRRHGGAVDEQDAPGRTGWIAGVLVP